MTYNDHIEEKIGEVSSMVENLAPLSEIRPKVEYILNEGVNREFNHLSLTILEKTIDLMFQMLGNEAVSERDKIVCLSSYLKAAREIKDIIQSTRDNKS
jgi:hypothetical protein